jgi:hypothetical protein
MKLLVVEENRSQNLKVMVSYGVEKDSSDDR